MSKEEDVEEGVGPLFSRHYMRVTQFMKLAGQVCRDRPGIPTLEERKLRARLHLEETLELIEGLGLTVHFEREADTFGTRISMDSVSIAENADDAPDLVEIADGCADISVVNIGTLIACGIYDIQLLKLVDENNLAKFGPGGYRDENGKWRKPPGHQPPDIARLLREQP